MNRVLKFILFSIVGAVSLMIPALYNHYPIVFGDTGTYIQSGFELVAPTDRPIIYGLFLRLTSLNGFSTWLVIFSQSLILSALLYMLLKRVLNIKSYLFGLFSIVFLTLFSGLAWTSSTLIADVFTPIALISGTIFVLGETNRLTKVLLCIIFYVSISSHLSHLMIFSPLFLLVFFFRKWLLPATGDKPKAWNAVILVVLAFATIAVTYPELGKKKYALEMGVLCEHGIAKPYLDEYCAQKNYKLCKYKDSLPVNACDFIWSSSTPFWRMGAWSDSNMDEYKDIIMGTFTTPKYIGMHITTSIKYTYMQLTSFLTGMGNGAYPVNTAPYMSVNTYLNKELGAYNASKQNQGTLSVFPWNDILTWVVRACVVLLLFITVFYRKKIFSNWFGTVTIMFLLGILLNAWDCGTFSMVNERYGSRIMGVLVFLVLIAVRKIYEYHRRKEPMQAS